MFTVKVLAANVNEASSSKPASPRGAPSDGAGPSNNPSPSHSAPTTPRATATVVDHLKFSAGNPRVEHITGVVHLYRHIPSDTEPATRSRGEIEELEELPVSASA